MKFRHLNFWNLDGVKTHPSTVAWGVDPPSEGKIIRPTFATRDTAVHHTYDKHIENKMNPQHYRHNFHWTKHLHLASYHTLNRTESSFADKTKASIPHFPPGCKREMRFLEIAQDAQDGSREAAGVPRMAATSAAPPARLARTLALPFGRDFFQIGAAKLW